MNTVFALVLVLHLLCVTTTAALSDEVPTQTNLTAEPGDIVTLPCFTTGNETPISSTWTKNGQKVEPSRDGGSPVQLPHGSLKFSAVTVADAGEYLCEAALPQARSFRARVLLQITSAPVNLSVSVGGARRLANGTFFAGRGASVFFRCSAALSVLSQSLSWSFSGASPSGAVPAGSTAGASLNFTIESVQPTDQGVYTCTARDPASNRTVDGSAELLVYYFPVTHPECTVLPTADPPQAVFSCSWPGTYPPPELRWGDTGDFQAADSLLVNLTGSQLTDGRAVTCTARHLLQTPQEEEHTCSLTLKLPYPEGKPMVAALERTNVTLTCSETTSFPVAGTTWTRGLKQERLLPGLKHVLSQTGPEFSLTIVNVSKEDEGVYFCRSKNALGVRELEVSLTVKAASSAYTGVVIGFFIAALIVGLVVAVARTIYRNRHRLCLGKGFTQIEDDGGDVLNLVDSDEEPHFQDAVPRLPPVTMNNHHTTLVQIHRIPSTDHDDAETLESSKPPPDGPDDSEDLVIF